MEDHAPSELLDRHGSIIEQEAHRFHLAKLDRSDLHQAGFVGLLTAAARFDPTRGPFPPYARLWVRKEMQRTIAGAEFNAVVPAEHIGRVIALRRLAESAPSIDELAKRIGLSPNVTAALIGSLSVGMPPGEVPHPRGESAEAAAMGRLLSSALTDAVTQLPEECRTVVAQHFGLDGEEPRSLRAIGRRLGISPSTARSRLDRALAQLRHLVDGTTTEGTRQMPTTPTVAAEWPAYGFAIDLPPDWEVFPGDGSNGSIVQIRTGTHALDLALNIWKLPSHGATSDQFAGAVKPRLEAGGYQDFGVTVVDAPDGFEGRRLIGRKADGWTTIQHYFSRGAATYVIGWGTQDPDQDRDVIERTTATFRTIP